MCGFLGNLRFKNICRVFSCCVQGGRWLGGRSAIRKRVFFIGLEKKAIQPDGASLI